MLSVLLLFSLTACGGSDNSNDADTQNSEIVSQIESEETDDETVSQKDEEVEWKQFIKEYDEWVDDYIALLKKYNDNPTDMTILSDYTEMMSDLTEWSTKADEVTEELENSPKAAAEYAAELTKIAEKLADAVK